MRGRNISHPNTGPMFERENFADLRSQAQVEIGRLLEAHLEGSLVLDTEGDSRLLTRSHIPLSTLELKR